MHTCPVTKSLERSGLRRTKGRHDILRCFQESRAWSIAQLHAALGGTVSTIYRNVEKLTEAGLLQEVAAHGSEAFYERTSEDHHDHIFCSNCEVVECTPCPAPQLPSHDLHLNIHCSSCQ